MDFIDDVFDVVGGSKQNKMNGREKRRDILKAMTLSVIRATVIWANTTHP